jgi:hypothetical protein
VLCGHEDVSPSHIDCHPFQMMSNINRCTKNIQDIKNISQKKAIWAEPIEKAQP